MKWKEVVETDRFYTIPLFFSGFVFLVLHIIFFGLVRVLPSKIPLFYSLPWGESQLASKQQFLLLPAVVLLVTALNSTLVWRLHPDQVVLRRMLFIAMAAFDLIILMAGIKIVAIFL